jgi:hypothetical protein
MIYELAYVGFMHVHATHLGPMQRDSDFLQAKCRRTTRGVETPNVAAPPRPPKVVLHFYRASDWLVLLVVGLNYEVGHNQWGRYKHVRYLETLQLIFWAKIGNSLLLRT